ncbi:multidrug effflux MFS transporter [Roseomonas sp. BN140053]|uniref:multidrug effflux MFS transporter n=1 Tax=Roseomonas sp. BN140053 TaxID=3391898 RepID=UPI0039E7B82E
MSVTGAAGTGEVPGGGAPVPGAPLAETPAPDLAGPGRGVRPPPLWLLVLMTFCGTLAMHIFVPALPQAGRDLGASTGAMQLTISLYLIGLAAGQLVYGPVSDRFGRRPVLFAGLALYTAAGLLAAVAPGPGWLVATRLLQALGGCAGLALGRAIVRDTAGPTAAAGRLALLNLMVTVGPGLAPSLGGALSETLGWRSIFWGLAALGATTIALSAWRLPETGRRAAGGSAASLLRDYGQLLRSRAFAGYVVGGGCATTSMYAFMAASPFIFVEQLHRPVHEVGVYYLVLIGGVTLGSVIANRLVARVGIERLLLRATLLGVGGAVLFLLAVLSGHLSVPLTLAPLLLFTVGCGVSSPLALTKAVGVNPKVIGSAAGLYGFGQMAIGALCTALAGVGGNPALAAAVVLVVAGVIGQLAFWTALRAERAGAARS